jgi:thioredoxin-dependent peroxiredoxin
MALKVGDRLPDFTSYTADGAIFDSKNLVGKKALVIYFYPKDDTRICTEQACSFRDIYVDFQQFGAEVIGISSDTVSSHHHFSKKHQLPFILLSDSDKKLRTLFGVSNVLLGLLPGRSTFVVDKEGIVQLVFNSQRGKIHIEKALEFLKRM